MFVVTAEHGSTSATATVTATYTGVQTASDLGHDGLFWGAVGKHVHRLPFDGTIFPSNLTPPTVHLASADETEAKLSFRARDDGRLLFQLRNPLARFGLLRHVAGNVASIVRLRSARTPISK